MASLSNNDLQVRISTDSDTKGIDETQKKLGGLNSVASKTVAIGKTLALGVVAVGAAVGIAGGFAIKSAASFETMNVALKTAFQGNAAAAAAASKQITDFAAKTPYELEEVMRSFVKLKNMGLDPSQKALTAYGDTASAMGKSLNDMVEAVADAATGEFERLKEFGIRSSSEGDKVKFTFQGVTTTVGKNSKEIEQYLIKLGQTKFAGGMEAQSKTLSGMWSTLMDTVNLAAAEIANKTGLFDLAKSGVQGLSDSVAYLSENIDTAIQSAVDFYNRIVEVGSAIYTYLKPNIDDLTRMFVDELVPSMMEMYATLGPVLIPALRALGLLIASNIIMNLKLMIDFMTFLFHVQAQLAEGITATSNAIASAFAWIVDRVNWLKDNWLYALGYIIGFFLTLPIKILLYIGLAILAIANYLRNVDWGGMWQGMVGAFQNIMTMLWNAFVDFHLKLLHMDWSGIAKNIAKSIGNGLASMLEGLINGALSGIPGAPKVNLGRFAQGTSFAPGGLALVGERGPELVNLPRGSQVTPASTTARMADRTPIEQHNTFNVFNQLDLDLAMEKAGYSLFARR